MKISAVFRLHSSPWTSYLEKQSVASYVQCVADVSSQINTENITMYLKLHPKQ